MSYYRELTYRTVGLQPHLEARADAEALDDVIVRQVMARQLGFLERERLLVDEYACRLVLEIGERRTLAAPAGHVAPTSDPYRRTFDEFITVVAKDLQRLIRRLDADHREVRSAYFTFRTRPYEQAVRDDFARRLETLCDDSQSEVEISTESEQDMLGARRLYGRIRGAIAGVHEVADEVRASGLVDPEDIRVQYAT